MSVSFPIPRQARPIFTGNQFTGIFNAPTLGVYDFDIPANQEQDVLQLFPGSVYLIDKIALGGTIASEVFNQSINLTTEMKFKRKLDKAVIYKLPFSVVTYIENRDFVAFTQSDKKGDFLTLSMVGVLNQVPATVGILNIKINVQLTIYAMDTTDYENWFKSMDYWKKNDPSKIQ